MTQGLPTPPTLSNPGSSRGSAQKAATFDVTCTCLGQGTIVNTDPAHTEALQVVGTNTVVVIPLNGAPGITAQANAAGTTCTFLNNDGPPGFPSTMPAVIISG
jgi:hypothetical protein